MSLSIKDPLIGLLCLALLLATGCRHRESGAADSAPSGRIEGRVLQGPVYPGPTRPDQPHPDRPFQARFQVLDPSGGNVASFESDAEGRFEIRLPVGTYFITPDASAPLIPDERNRREIVITEGQILHVEFHFDSGMR